MTAFEYTDPTYLNAPEVTLVDVMGTDASITKAARVSTGKADIETTDEREQGLITYLMKSQHGSPFEHAVMTFYVKAPIFVFREFHRHRIASYNEMSGRYTTLPGEFYLPPGVRPLVNIGTSARPEFAPGTLQQFERYVERTAHAYTIAWETYQDHLADGIANEMARVVLPVGIFSQMYATMNLRAMMNFLSLRVDSPLREKRTRPQFEIQQVAEQIEQHFAAAFPMVHAAFLVNGRMAP